MNLKAKTAMLHFRLTALRAKGAKRLARLVLPILMAIPLSAVTRSVAAGAVSPAVASPVPALPPLAVVDRRDDSGQTWQVEGHLPGNLRLAAQDFKIALQSQGWRLDKVIPLNRSLRPVNLFLWKKGNLDMLMMFHDDAVARTGFAIGIDKHSNKVINQRRAQINK